MSEHKCFCNDCKASGHCPLNIATNQYKAVVKQNKSLQQELNELKSKGLLKKENKYCPSYDNGDCQTFPTPYIAKCKDIGDCRWKDFDFCQQKRIKNTQLEQKAKQAKEELENLLEFFTVDESEMNRAMVKMKNKMQEIAQLATEGMKRFDYSQPECCELQKIANITEDEK